MPRDPYAALHALMRAEAVRTAPAETTRPRPEAPAQAHPRAQASEPENGMRREAHEARLPENR
ncbi:hypothetical protein SALBM135S_03281 [Streptomyces alboniger]